MFSFEDVWRWYSVVFDDHAIIDERNFVIICYALIVVGFYFLNFPHDFLFCCLRLVELFFSLPSVMYETKLQEVLFGLEVADEESLLGILKGSQSLMFFQLTFWFVRS